MAGIVKKMMGSSRSKSASGKEFGDYYYYNGNNCEIADISIALEYTGSPVNNNATKLLKVLPVDVDSIPTANIAATSPVNLYNLSLPVVEPIFVTTTTTRFITDHHHHPSNGADDTSGSLGFSDTSHDLSQSSDLLELETDTPIDYLQSDSLHFAANFGDEEEDPSDDEREHLQRRRRRRSNNNDNDNNRAGAGAGAAADTAYSHYSNTERPVPVRPPKKGMCYHCHRGSRVTDKQACLVCDAKYCKRCIRKAMGSMPQGRKCLTCIGLPVHASKRKMLGNSSRVLRAAFNRQEVIQIMEAELSSTANHLPPHCIFVNGAPLSFNELILLHTSPNPPSNLQPGSYWYDRVSGLWGKEGHKPCQIITPNLNVGEQKIMTKASNGNTNILINGREITKVEQFVLLKTAGVMCEGNPTFWLHADGTLVLEGMKKETGNIWSKKSTKLLCALLSLPTPQHPNPRGKSNGGVADGALSNYLEQKSSSKVLLLGTYGSGTSTIYKQARVIYDIPFSEEERRNIKYMIQRNLYGYLGRLLEGRELFEEESLLEMKRQSTDPGPSDSIRELHEMTKYTVGKELKLFCDGFIDTMVSGNLDMISISAPQDFAPRVEELWNHAAIQATYNRFDELELPRVAKYFLDKGVEVAKEDYEPSDTDIMYAEDITSSPGLGTMEFSFPHPKDDDCRNPNDQPDAVTRYELIRVQAKSLGQKCKWLEMFEDVGIVLFCVSLIDYDEYGEDNSGLYTNRMLQSKRLFESIITHPTYKDKNFLLILNKFDLLEEKIEQVPLARCEWFEDFNPVFSRHQSTRRGGNSTAPLAQRAFHYIGMQFKKLFKSLTGRKLYVCPVTALESDTVDSALRYAREILRWDEDKLNYSSINDFSSESIDNSYCT